MSSIKRVKAFTLIELLIVVAIIAILAAIAVPNFIEAQIRAKVSRVKADIRSLAVAEEAYCVDYNNYPPCTTDAPLWDPLPFIDRLVPLATPVAYITSLPEDPFQRQTPAQYDPLFMYQYTVWYTDASLKAAWEGFFDPTMKFKWTLMSGGPSQGYACYNWMGVPGLAGVINYDPSNGTISNGAIYYFGPGGGFGLLEMPDNNIYNGQF